MDLLLDTIWCQLPTLPQWPRTKKSVRAVQRQLKDFQDGVVRGGRSGNVTLPNIDIPVKGDRSARRGGQRVRERFCKPPLQRRLMSHPPPPSLFGKADQSKLRESTRLKQGATTQVSGGKLSDGVGAGTSSKAMSPPPAKRTTKVRKISVGRGRARRW